MDAQIKIDAELAVEISMALLMYMSLIRKCDEKEATKIRQIIEKLRLASESSLGGHSHAIH